MRDVIVLGNGFDLYCKLKSSYNDFFSKKYNEFDKNIFDGKHFELVYQKQDIDSLGEECNRLEKYMKSLNYNLSREIQFSEPLQRQKLQNEITELKEEIKSKKDYLDELDSELIKKINNLFNDKDFSFWDYIFMFKAEMGNNENLLWSDVENEILNTLQRIDEEWAASLLFFYINTEKYRQDEIFLSTSEFFKFYNYDDIYDFLLQELNIFENSFKEYLMNELDENNQQYQSRAHELFKKIVYKKDEQNKIIITENLFYVINFNYTVPFSNIEKRNIYCMNNIHGDLFSDEVIFGIDGFDDGISEELNFFTKTSRIMSLDKHTYEPIPQKDEVNNIYFFGHSLSDADYSYFLSIFDYYDIYGSNVKLNFVYFRYSGSAKKNLLKSINLLMDNYGRSFDNKAKGKNLMHKLNLENRLIIKEI